MAKFDVILAGRRFVDTQIIKCENIYYAFATETETFGGSSTLEIFSSTKLNGPYKHFQTIKNTALEERGAGPIFQYMGKLIRPTQNCNTGYGEGLIFNELKLENGHFYQDKISCINSDSSKKYGLCLHTFSPFGSYAAVDGFDYPCRLIGRLAPKIYNFKFQVEKSLGKWK